LIKKQKKYQQWYNEIKQQEQWKNTHNGWIILFSF
jgi:hypothetical protein